LKLLFYGDISAKIGRKAVASSIKNLREEYSIDFCIANAENASHGKGLSLACADELLSYGIDFITMGNHTWSNSSIMDFIDDYPIIRPANFSKNLPGKGYAVVETPKGKIGILNLQGRIFMDPVDNPFECAMQCVNELQCEASIIIVDFHAEATSEKIAMANYLDGMVSAVLGTHTHVQTADERILPGGTAFISDVGMTGASNGIIGMDSKAIVDRFVYSLPKKFEPANGKAQVNAVVLEINELTGITESVTRIQL